MATRTEHGICQCGHSTHTHTASGCNFPGCECDGYKAQGAGVLVADELDTATAEELAKYRRIA